MNHDKIFCFSASLGQQTLSLVVHKQYPQIFKFLASILGCFP